MFLFINTSEHKELTFVLAEGPTLRQFKTELAFNENYKTNEYLEKFLKHEGVRVSELTKIIVCSGPGSFTGIRVGMSLAQALGFALKIPVVAIKQNKIPDDLRKLTSLKTGKTVVAEYGRKPNITIAKQK